MALHDGVGLCEGGARLLQPLRFDVELGEDRKIVRQPETGAGRAQISQTIAQAHDAPIEVALLGGGPAVHDRGPGKIIAEPILGTDCVSGVGMHAHHRWFAAKLVQHRGVVEGDGEAERVVASSGQLDRFADGQECTIRKAEMPVDMRSIGAAVDVDVDASREGVGGITGTLDLAAGRLQVGQGQAMLAQMEQVEPQRMMGVSLAHEVVAPFNQLEQFSAELARAGHLTAYVIDVAQATQRPGAIALMPLPAGEFLGSGVGRLDLGCTEALGCDQRRSQSDLDLELLALARLARRRALQHGERSRQVTDRFLVGRALPRQSAGAQPPIQGAVLNPSLREMTGEEFGLALEKGGELRFERGGDTRMNFHSPALEQGRVGDILDQRVLEGVGRVGRLAAPEDQIGADEPDERFAERRLLQRRHRGQEIVIELAADAGADLRQLLGRCQPVQPGQERVPARSREWRAPPVRR